MSIRSRPGWRAFTFFLQTCTANETRLYLGVASDDTGGEPARIQAETDFNNFVYDEDPRLPEDFAEPRLPLDPHREFSTLADANLLEYRQILSDICGMEGENS